MVTHLGRARVHSQWRPCPSTKTSARHRTHAPSARFHSWATSCRSRVSSNCGVRWVASTMPSSVSDMRTPCEPSRSITWRRPAVEPGKMHERGIARTTRRQASGSSDARARAQLAAVIFSRSIDCACTIGRSPVPTTSAGHLMYSRSGVHSTFTREAVHGLLV